LSNNWIAEHGNPWLTDIYPEGDPNRFVDCLLRTWSAVAERIHTQGGLPDEMSEAIWNTGPSFSTAIACNQAAHVVTEKNPIAHLMLLREGLDALITIGTNWNDVPDDAPPPTAVDIVADLSQAYAEWAEDYTLHAVPPPELLNMLTAPILAFNRNTWPQIELEDALSFDAYDVVGEGDEPPSPEVYGRILRFPLAIGAIIRWKEHWVPTDWKYDPNAIDLADRMQIVAADVKHDLMTAVSMTMEALEMEWPDWANSLLPLSDE